MLIVFSFFYFIVAATAETTTQAPAKVSLNSSSSELKKRSSASDFINQSSLVDQISENIDAVISAYTSDDMVKANTKSAEEKSLYLGGILKFKADRIKIIENVRLSVENDLVQEFSEQELAYLSALSKHGIFKKLNKYLISKNFKERLHIPLKTIRIYIDHDKKSNPNKK